jgi:hypothetical protein
LERIKRSEEEVLKQKQRSPSQVKGEGLKILSRRGSQVQILPAAPSSKGNNSIIPTRNLDMAEPAWPYQNARAFIKTL